MSTKITADDLERILTRWEGYDIPNGVQDKTFALSTPAVNKIFEMISLIGSFDEKTGYALGQTIGAVVTRPFALCYFIGYELASGKMSREDGTPYLMAATEPIQDFVVNIAGVLVGKGIADQETVRKMALEISTLTGEASNDICILGIENFMKIGYR